MIKMKKDDGYRKSANDAPATEYYCWVRGAPATRMSRPPGRWVQLFLFGSQLAGGMSPSSERNSCLLHAFSLEVFHGITNIILAQT